MAAVTRLGDSTTGVCNKGLSCCPHGRSGTNQTGSPNVFVNGKPVHRLQDTGAAHCPHGGTFQSIKGSSSVFVNGQPVTRLGDTTACLACGQAGTHTNGSPNVFAGG
jgi:uncharacterized Zn-binding protein involved in type VI secretion